MNNSGGGGEVVSETRVVDEIPDAMRKLAMLIARGFYSMEHGIVMDYLQRNICVKEEDLRRIVKFEQRQLRQILIQLKVDKLIKERIVSEEVEGRSRKINYYFINYRALLNVTKYKIDHMRQKLESREKDDTHKASYKCTGCGQHYEVGEVDTIFDMLTQELKCWRCHAEVIDDVTAGPTSSTRSLLANFNDQLTTVFALLEQLDGVHLAPHLLEPALNMLNLPADAQMAANDQANAARRLQDGRLNPNGQLERYQISQGIIVNIEGTGAGNTSGAIEPKQMPAWLQEQAIGSSGLQPLTDDYGDNVKHQDNVTASVTPTTSVDIVNHLLRHEERHGEERRDQLKTENDKIGREEQERAEEDDEEELMVMVRGEKRPLNEITPDLVALMSEEERVAYVQMTRDQFDY